jgi:NAD(P)H-nitrite reductase large subunit
VSPNIEIVKGTKIEAARGVLVNDYLETSVPGVYAAGDCAEIRSTQPGGRNRVEQLWYTGRMQAEALAKTILGERTAYDRGIWFNSAKFLDIEYQTYGFVPNMHRQGEETFYWEHPSGKKSLRLVFDTSNRVLLGVNVFGIRLRHRVFERWIREKHTVDQVVQDLDGANFDPEFFENHGREIASAFRHTALPSVA